MEGNVEWRNIASSTDVREGEAIARKSDENEVLLVRRGGKVCSCGNLCTHYGAPLDQGVLNGDVIVCPWHNSRFDVRTGKVLSAPALDDLPVYEIQEENGRILTGKKHRARLPVSEKRDERLFAVVGAGASAIAAAMTLRREGFSGSIVLITEEDASPYDRPALTKGYAAGTSGDDSLPLRKEEFYERHGIEILRNTTVIRVDAAAHLVMFESGGSLSYSKLLLASGGTPVALPVEGNDLSGINMLRTWRDAKAVVTSVEASDKIVLVGSSFIAMELASGFIERGKDVTVVAPGSVPFEKVFGERIGGRFLKEHEAKGVKFRLGRTVKRFSGDTAVRSVVLDTGEELPADAVVIGVGVRPRVEYLSGSGLEEDGEVPVDDGFRTMAPDVYAAGDIARVSLPGGGEAVRIEHWTVAERQGMYAALSMLDRGRPYEEPPFFWTMQQGLSLQYIGRASGNDTVRYRGDVENGDFLAGYYRDGTLLAAASIGMSRDLMALGELMRNGVDLPEDSLADTEFDIPTFMKRAIG